MGVGGVSKKNFGVALPSVGGDLLGSKLMLRKTAKPIQLQNHKLDMAKGNNSHKKEVKKPKKEKPKLVATRRSS